MRLLRNPSPNGLKSGCKGDRTQYYNKLGHGLLAQDGEEGVDGAEESVRAEGVEGHARWEVLFYGNGVL